FDAGWVAPPEATALVTMLTRVECGFHASLSPRRRAARAVTAYTTLATALSFHRRRAHLAGPSPDFAARERELLELLWQYRTWAGPALLQAWACGTGAPGQRAGDQR
ncbi:PrsW family intramembrane metalloprotease, partial [Streptomyces noursei]